MSHTRPVALGAAALLTVLAAGSGPAADARPPAKPGRVTNLHVGVVTKPATKYQLPLTWTAGASTTSYRVSAADAAGAVLDKATVTDPSWLAVVVGKADSTVQITVTPYDGRRKGPASKVSTVLPDLTAPAGTFQLSRTGQDVTVTQTALTDDLSGQADIARVVDWKDGSAPQAWTSGTQIGHRYSALGLWHPTVTLTDAAGNTAEQPLGVVVIGDEQAPTGAYAATPSAAWAAFTAVGLTETALDDDWSANADIQRTVDWGDGTQEAWPAGTVTASHVYADGGVFTPRMTLVDEAGNRAVVGAEPVTVTRDTAAPSVRLRLPARHRTSVRAWRTLRGSAADAGTGVAVVRVKAVQKRATGWYAYRPATGRWLRVATGRAAWRKARVASVVPTDTGRWRSRVRGLRKGVLVYRVVARDNVGNTSPGVTHRQRLTRR